MTKNISLLIHGTASHEWLEKIYGSIKTARFGFKQIVLVSYVDDLDYYRERIRSLHMEESVSIVSCKDVINPGFFNINRQIKTVKAGLDYLDKDTWVIKLRNDQSANFNKLKRYIDTLEEHKLLTTNCYTRSDRLYHPSDMLLCAEYKTMYDYFSCEPMMNTHLGHIMEVRSECKKSKGAMKAVPIVPESYLFRSFLDKTGWTILETKEDSLNALKKYIRLVNSWDIDYKWKSARPPLSAKSLILPYTFNRIPFDGGPREHARCMNRHELMGGYPTLRDLFFMCICKCLFGWGTPLNKNRIKYNVLRQIRALMPLFPARIANKYRAKLERKILKAKQKSEQ